MDAKRCPFCCPEPSRIRRENEIALAVLDSYPVSEGHTLIIPRRHVTCFFDLAPTEQSALWRMVAEVRAELLNSYKLEGFNIGINDGTAAGQTVMHAHVHVIPRRSGDVLDPRGGVRWVIPGKAAYWAGGEE